MKQMLAKNEKSTAFGCCFLIDFTFGFSVSGLLEKLRGVRQLSIVLCRLIYPGLLVCVNIQMFLTIITGKKILTLTKLSAAVAFLSVTLSLYAAESFVSVKIFYPVIMVKTFEY